MSVWSKFLNAIAAELSLLDDAILLLIREAVPGLAVNLLPEWETMLGLPDVCGQLATTIEERQLVAHAKYIAHYNGLSAQFFIDYAATMGTTIVITENYGGGTPFRVDHARVDQTQEDGIDGARLWSLGIYHTWAVTISASDPNKDYLHCYFTEIKPAHTEMIWLEV